MKKKVGIIVITAVLLGAVGFAFFMSSTGSEFFKNYGSNFKSNMNAIMKKLNIPVKEEQTDEEKQYEELVKQYEEEKQKKQDEIDQKTEADNKEHQSTNIGYSGTNIAFDDAKNARFAKYSGGILAVDETKMTFYNKNAKERWSANLQISAPVLKVGGSNILIFEKNGTKFAMYNASKKVYEKSVDGTIKTASVSAGGDVVVVYDRGNYKGSIGVYNKSGDEVYLWNSGKYSVISADISESRRLGAALLDADNGVSSKVYFFNIEKSGTDAELDLADSLVFDVDFNGDTLNAYADNAVYGISGAGKVRWTYELGEKKITRYTMSEGGTKAIALDNNNTSELGIISAAGKEKASVKIDVLPDFVDVSDNRILYNDERTVIITDMDGNIVSKYSCSRDIKKAYIIDSNNIFIAYNSSIEFLKTNAKSQEAKK